MSSLLRGSEDQIVRDAIDVARQVISDEADALRQVAAGLGDSFARVVGLLLEPQTLVIVSGLGKSGHIGRLAPGLSGVGTGGAAQGCALEGGVRTTCGGITAVPPCSGGGSALRARVPPSSGDPQPTTVPEGPMI